MGTNFGGLDVVPLLGAIAGAPESTQPRGGCGPGLPGADCSGT